MHTYLVIGCGQQGAAIAHDLCRSASPASVAVTDIDPDRAARLARHLGCRATRTADPRDLDDLTALLMDADVAVSAIPYEHNLALTKAAIASRTHLCDLGGNNDVVAAQFALDDEARAARVRIVPDCGIAPGAVSIFAQHAIDLLGRDPAYVRIRVGGLPQRPQGSFGYAKAFSVHGLVNEYIEPAEALRDGALVTIDALDGHEVLQFDDLGTLEAASTSGGSSTLARTYEGRVKELDYKTLRYPGHWTTVRAMIELGFFGGEGIDAGSATVSPRELSEALLERNLPPGGDDLIVARITAGDDKDEVRIEFIDRADPATGHSAMQRCTGYSAGIIAAMAANDRIASHGVLRQELAVDPAEFISEWRRRGMPFSAIKGRGTRRTGPVRHG